MQANEMIISWTVDDCLLNELKKNLKSKFISN